MSGWRQRRGPLPDQPEGNLAELRKFPQGRKARPKPAKPVAPPETNWVGSLGDIEPYDPAKHGGKSGELYNQADLDALNEAGFQPHDRGMWYRPTPGDETGAGHYVVHSPGYMHNNKLAPWHVTRDPEEAGRNFRSLRGLNGALRNLASAYPDWTKIGAGKTPAQLAADKWLEENPEGFESWEPSQRGYTHSDVPDVAGQSFSEHGETTPLTLPGSHFEEENQAMRTPVDRSYRDGWTDRDWEMYNHNPSERGGYRDEDDEYEEPDLEHEALESHGFNGPSPIRGAWHFDQHDVNGDHIASHILTKDRSGKWNLETRPVEDGGSDQSPQRSQHHFLHDALDQYKQNSANILLPRHGYEPVRGRTGYATHWTRTDPSPEGDPRHEDYSHDISFPETGFLGSTHNSIHLPNGAGFAPNGHTVHNSDELADVVKEHNKLSAGIHPGGRRDMRLGADEFSSHPIMASLGRPYSTQTPWADGRVSRAMWTHPTSESPGGLHTQAEYNWNTGNYDFSYRNHLNHALSPTNPVVPAGAPVTVPGRQTQPPLESAR